MERLRKLFTGGEYGFGFKPEFITSHMGFALDRQPFLLFDDNNLFWACPPSEYVFTLTPEYIFTRKTAEYIGQMGDEIQKELPEAIQFEDMTDELPMARLSNGLMKLVVSDLHERGKLVIPEQMLSIARARPIPQGEIPANETKGLFYLRYGVAYSGEQKKSIQNALVKVNDLLAFMG